MVTHLFPITFVRIKHMIKIHQFSGSGYAWRVFLTAALKGLDYEIVSLQPSPDDLKVPEFLKLNPRGKVPVMQDGPVVLRESMAIMAYLDWKHPEPPLLGATAEETGLIWQMVCDFDNYVADDWVYKIIVPILLGQIESDGAPLQEAAQAAHDEVQRLETELGGNSWFAGTSLTAVDIAIYPLLESLLRFTNKELVADLDLGFDTFANRYPQLERWRRAIQALPCYEQTYPVYWRQVDGAAA